MSKRKGQTNGSTTRNKPTSAASGNAPEIDAAGAPRSADGAPLDTASIVDGSNGVDGAADGKGLSDGGRQELPGLEAGEGATPGADTKAADPAGEIVSGDIGAGSGSGSIENDGDASADGATDDGKNGSVSRQGGDQAGSVGGGDPSTADGTGDAGGSPQGNGDQVAAAADGDGSGIAGPDISPDLKAALELAGCDTAENLIDMARIGSNVMEAIDDIRKLDGPFKDWAPMDDPAEIVHDLFNALEYARERAGATPASDPDGSPASNEAPPEIDCCPICDVPFKPDDVCATDVTEGTCHAECLAGTSVVDLETGKPHDGPICTFLYSDDVPGMPAATIGAEMAIMDNLAGSAMLSAEFAWDGAWDAFFTHTHPETCADGQPEFPLSPTMGRDLAEYVRRIGRRATPEILVQQLVILKHRQSADLSEQERIALRTFVATLLDLDDFAAAEKKRLEELAAEKPEPKPLPIEDTTMETVSGTMDTF
ncbi:hypothetical protein [Agrobacterium sp. ST15.13.015]|uniref:hypothetical protein n=1 Tax=Agrobacterium sp. ST15.13.015 TaxID=3017319 RepID=UPI0022C89838|nr:hypothetical protein [Agrobacterium sp. ST15.13.015]MCZ7500711.1 hypothetical protein [Rhizobium rhizogenes]